MRSTIFRVSGVAFVWANATVAWASSGNFHGGPQLRIERKRLCQLKHLLANAGQGLGVLVISERFHDPGAGLEHFSLFHAARGESRRTDADTAGLERRVAIERYGIFIYGD